MSDMRQLKGLNLVLAFLLELAMLAGFAVWGWSISTSTPVRLAAAVLAPGAVMVLWGLAVAPRAPSRLPRPWLEVAKALIFVLAAVALAAAGHGGWGLALVLGFAVSLGLALRWDQTEVSGRH